VNTKSLISTPTVRIYAGMELQFLSEGTVAKFFEKAPSEKNENC
jgi:hypothetical protein